MCHLTNGRRKDLYLNGSGTNPELNIRYYKLQRKEDDCKIFALEKSSSLIYVGWVSADAALKYFCYLQLIWHILWQLEATEILLIGLLLIVWGDL